MTGDTFRERREFLGYSQRAFAERLGLSERTIRYYESGEVPINRTVELLLQAVELDEK
jgi:transcriptional regulator with XRE-family HTH domain